MHNWQLNYSSLSGVLRFKSHMQQQTEQMLDGVKVLDLSNLIAGPGISTILADFGADVIKVEHPQLGDYIRNWGHKKKRGAPGLEIPRPR